MGAEGARRPCADYWALNSPNVRHAESMPKVDTEMLNFLHGKDALFSIGMRGGHMQDLMYAGLVEAARSATRHELFQVCVLSPSAHAMRRRSSCTSNTMLCAT